jgi:hypothetical protein
MRSLAVYFFPKSIHLASKFAYNICLHLQRFNDNQLETAGVVQTIPPWSWCKAEVRDLPEFSRGRRWRQKLARILLQWITLDQPPPRDDRLSNESWNTIERIANETRARIDTSRLYIQDLEEHGETDDNRALLPMTFQPEMTHFVGTQRLFNLIPNPSFVKKYVKIEFRTIKSLLKKENLARHAGVNVWQNVLNLKRIKGTSK